MHIKTHIPTPPLLSGRGRRRRAAARCDRSETLVVIWDGLFSTIRYSAGKILEFPPSPSNLLESGPYDLHLRGKKKNQVGEVSKNGHSPPGSIAVIGIYYSRSLPANTYM